MPLNTIFPATPLSPMTPIAPTGESTGIIEFLPITVAVGPAVPPSAEAERKAERARADAGPWVGCSEESGVVEIHDPRMFRDGRQAFCRALVTAAVDQFRATSAEVRLGSSACRLVFGPGRFDRAELARRAAGAIRSATPAARDGSGCRERPAGAGWSVLTAFAAAGGALVVEARDDLLDEVAAAADPADAMTGAGRLTYLALAGGSFLLTIAGVILPGIPTLPFAMMTARYAVRVSPRFEGWLKRRPWLAGLLAGDEDSPGRNLDWSSLVKTVGLAAILIAAILVLHPPLPVVLGLELALMAQMAWREMVPSCQPELDLGLLG